MSRAEQQRSSAEVVKSGPALTTRLVIALLTTPSHGEKMDDRGPPSGAAEGRQHPALQIPRINLRIEVVAVWHEAMWSPWGVSEQERPLDRRRPWGVEGERAVRSGRLPARRRSEATELCVQLGLLGGALAYQQRQPDRARELFAAGAATCVARVFRSGVRASGLTGSQEQQAYGLVAKRRAWGPRGDSHYSHSVMTAAMNERESWGRIHV